MNDQLPTGIYPIEDEHLAKCAGCTGQWDNHDTGPYCRYGMDPERCEVHEGGKDYSCQYFQTCCIMGVLVCRGCRE